MSEAGLSRRAVARMTGVSDVAVGKAAQRGLLDVMADGKIDPTGPRTRAWLDAHKPQNRRRRCRAAAQPSPILAERTASLMIREYELEVARANAVDRAELAMTLYAEAAAWEGAMREFPVWAGPLIASILRTPAATFIPRLEAALTEFLRRRGDQRDAIDQALERAARRWRDFPPHRMLHPPPPPPFDAPATLAEAQRRYAEARGALARIKMRGRGGELLAAWPAHFAAEDLRIGWIRGFQDEFAAAHGAELLATARLPVEHDLLCGLWFMTSHLAVVALRPLWPGREIPDDVSPAVMAELRTSIAAAAQRRQSAPAENERQTEVTAAT
jgi:hypothetical protein